MTVPWIDISVPIYSGMVHWPDNPAVLIERMQDMSRGDAANVSKLELGAHTGTHMDAPHHFFADGAGHRNDAPRFWRTCLWHGPCRSKGAA